MRCLVVRILLFGIFFCSSVRLLAVDDTAFIVASLRRHIDVLASPQMKGRGYVRDGRVRAAHYIEKQFRQLGLEPVGDGGFQQHYTFPVNSFPGAMQLTLSGRSLTPGADYLVDAGSASFSGAHLPIRVVDLSAQPNLSVAFGFDPAATMWVLHGVDSFCCRNGVRRHSLPSMLPRGCYIIPQSTKAMWTVDRQQQPATVLYVADSLVPSSGNADVKVQARLREMKSANIIGCVPGTLKDSFIVFSAHYDHLGMMGSETIFPGASDNASGSSMLLYLAGYYARHPQRYTIVFIAFSGEEAGLMGSAWFVDHPTLPLSHIRFLTNLDIMGDATDGITVVNATEYPARYSQLTGINDAHHYLPVIKSRGKAANSDHYHFAEAGVPAIFIYTNGGKGYYHDIYDKPSEVTFRNVPQIALLLQDFVTGMQEN
ncbi:MAG: M28 family peptidase [Taibaiella sp.]|nr:M28 family peptidase [Taibaiella sp.]